MGTSAGPAAAHTDRPLERAGGAVGPAERVAVCSMRGRLDRALGAASAAPAPALIVTASLGRLREMLRQAAAWSGRVLVLAPALDAATVDRRLHEFGAGRYAVLAVGPERLWQARVALALRVSRPSVAVIEDSCFALADAARELATGRVLERLRALAPGARVLVVSAPGSGAPAGSLEGSLLPAPVACAVELIGAEHERLMALRRAMPGQGRALLIAPSRGAAVRLAGGLARLGLDAAPYHLGLLAAERGAMLRAYQDGRQGLLVATAAILQEERLPGHPLLGFTHPPPSLAAVLRLASLADDALGPARLLVCCGERDRAALSGAPLGATPTLAQLRRLYRALRHMGTGGSVTLDLDGPEIPAGLGDLGTPEAVRAMLDLLESAGYVRREDDVPKAAQIVLSEGPLPPWLASLGVTRPGTPFPIQPNQAARKLGLSAAALQGRLLEAEGRGLLRYGPIGRERHYTLCAAAADSASLLGAMLRSMEADAARDARRVALWLRGGSCRVADLAAALGLPEQPRCGRCDLCAPRQASSGEPEPRLVALAALAGLALDMPRGAVYRVVRTGLSAAGLAADRRAVSELIDDLLATGALEAHQGNLGDLVRVGTLGARLLAGRAT